ncbi:transcriptional regulator, TetR family [Methylobacterium sp. UNC378MF]|uniref:TetR/AcrR family transcriptional regulator n=1 Tax=Methylobacterium sp. UNC378MF TaxID=1502748 RepID=UPI000892129E|nr:TetR/AcrR family transcriptional regulator [Methylobacterium sp. UNC378MF]SDA33040.1 transcriptional regulator, TetR family [Methylobacterium sp. UNC378MF]
MPRVSREQAKANRQRVVEVASTLFRERGLHGIGVADIMAAADLTHGGFYGQFANKDALAAEAFDVALAEEYRGTTDTVVANYLSLDHVHEPGKGCPLAALANDVSREVSGSLVRERFTTGVEHLASIVADPTPGASEELRRDRSLAVVSTLVGAVVLARAVDDENLAKDLVRSAQALITS